MIIPNNKKVIAMVKSITLSKIGLVIIVCIFLASCAKISYSPKVSLDISPETIKKTVQVEKFTDSSPSGDREDPFSGASITNEDALVAALNLEVTNAIISDFSTNALFSSISRRVENPDYIMKGEIKKFKGHTGMNTYAKIAFALSLGGSLIGSLTLSPEVILVAQIPLVLSYFGIPISLNESEIEITISLYDKNNNLIKTYSARATEENHESMYVQQALALPSQTNRTFSAVVKQLREQILVDIKKYY
jgi:hypothetical protein